MSLKRYFSILHILLVTGIVGLCTALLASWATERSRNLEIQNLKSQIRAQVASSEYRLNGKCLVEDGKFSVLRLSVESNFRHAIQFEDITNRSLSMQFKSYVDSESNLWRTDCYIYTVPIEDGIDIVVSRTAEYANHSPIVVAHVKDTVPKFNHLFGVVGDLNEPENIDIWRAPVPHIVMSLVKSDGLPGPAGEEVDIRQVEPDEATVPRNE